MTILSMLTLALPGLVLAEPMEIKLPAPTGENKETFKERGTPARPDRMFTGVTQPTLTVYLPDENPTGTAVVICPGGGYSSLAIDKEGHEVARWFNEQGVAAFVLKYRLPQRDALPDPLPLQDARNALQLVRNRAGEWHLNPQRVGVMGFSAGGHLAAMTGTRLTGDTRPNFLLLVYPVISMREGITNTGTRTGLLGENPTPEMVSEFSNEANVTAQTPPTFLVHARDDGVSVENSLLFAAALDKAGVPHEAAIYERGGHGYGLAKGRGEVESWPARCAAWLRSRGLISTGVKP